MATGFSFGVRKMTNQIDPSLSEKYMVRDEVDAWTLHCKICHAGFRLKKPGNHPGNLLALLDHHAECEQNGNKANL